MIRILLLLLAVSACTSVPKLPSKPRLREAQGATAVVIEASCHDPYGQFQFVNKEGIASGVILNERQVLTAYHVVRCPFITKVRVTLPNGTFRLMQVIKEDKKNDLAVLELTSLDNFGLGFSPPTIAKPPAIDEPLCSVAAYPKAETHCGPLIDIKEDYIIIAAEVKHGNSGSAVYDLHGNLIAITTNAVACAADSKLICSQWARLLYKKKF